MSSKFFFIFHGGCCFVQSCDLKVIRASNSQWAPSWIRNQNRHPFIIGMEVIDNVLAHNCGENNWLPID
jgi:hypothetical protein